MRDLPHLSSDAFNGLNQLFEFFFYSLFILFAPLTKEFLNENPNVPNALAEKFPQLKKTVMQIKQKIENGTFVGGIFIEFINKNPTVQTFQSNPNTGGNAKSDGIVSDGVPTPSSASDRSGGSDSSSSSTFPSFNKEKFFPSVLAKKLGIGSDKKGGAAAASSSTSSSTFSLAANAEKLFSSSSSTAQQFIVALPQIVSVPHIELNSPETLQGFVHRASACEALSAIVESLQMMSKHMKAQLPSADQAKVDELCQFAVTTHQNFRNYMYATLPHLLLPRDSLSQRMNGVRWDVKDLQTKPNSYVESIKSTLKGADLFIKGCGGLPDEIMKSIWTSTLQYLSFALVDAYASVKKLTSEGIALMRLDLSQLSDELEKITSLKPLPTWELLSNYVQAFYRNQSDLMQFILDHPQYTMQQCIALGMNGCAVSSGFNKKQKEELQRQIQSQWNASQALAADNARREKEREKQKASGKEKEKEKARMEAANSKYPPQQANSSVSPPVESIESPHATSTSALQSSTASALSDDHSVAVSISSSSAPAVAASTSPSMANSISIPESSSTASASVSVSLSMSLSESETSQLSSTSSVDLVDKVNTDGVAEPAASGSAVDDEEEELP